MHILITLFYFLTAPSFSIAYPVGASMGSARSTSPATRKFAFGCASNAFVLAPQTPYRVAAPTPILPSPSTILRSTWTPSSGKLLTQTALVSLKSLSHCFKYCINLLFLSLHRLHTPISISAQAPGRTSRN